MKKKPVERKWFETTGIQETGWLTVKGFIPEAYRNGIGLMAWKFEDTDKLRNSLKEFSENGLIGVTDYNKSISMLKRGMNYMKANYLNTK